KGAPTSVIWWDDYDAPAKAVPDAASSQPAIDGAPKLDHFEEGLHATHNPTDSPHNTVIGHSYGSTLVGNAAKANGIPYAGDVIAIGSPGMDVNRASDLHVGSGPPPSPGYPHVWAARTTNDIIQWAQDSHGTSPVRE